MNFNTFKIQDKVNGFYFYIVSHIDDPEFNLDVCESYASEDPQNPINQYLTLCVGWDSIESTKSDVQPITVLNKSYPQDPKNMAVSEEYKKFTEEALQQLSMKKPRGGKKKQTEEGASPANIPEKKPAKPKGKKTTIVGVAPQ